jgi:hypothetical protein
MKKRDAFFCFPVAPIRIRSVAIWVGCDHDEESSKVTLKINRNPESHPAESQPA